MENHKHTKNEKNQEEVAGIPANAMNWIDQHLQENPDLAEMVEEEMQRLQLGETLRSLRYEKGLTQAELASRTHTSQSMIARIENGHQSNLRIDTLIRLARALEKNLRVNFMPPEA